VVEVFAFENKKIHCAGQCHDVGEKAPIAVLERYTRITVYCFGCIGVGVDKRIESQN